MTDTSSDATTASTPPRRGGFLSPFQHPIYRQTWLANLGVFSGGMIQMTGASWMMTTLTSDPSLIALVQASTTLPIMLFSVVAGAIADNFHRRRVMMIANAFTFIISVTLLIFALTGLMTPWWLLSFTFLVGCGGALNNPSWQASVGDLVPRHDLAGAVTLNSVCFNLSRSLAPALGGILISIFGVASTFAYNALSYLGLLGVLSRWPEVQAQSTLPREKIGRSIFVGLRYASMSPNLGRVLLRSFVFGIGAVSALALLPVVARELVHGGPRTFGLMLGAIGIGGLCGAFLNNRVRSAMTNESIIRLGFILSAGGTIILALSSNLWLSCLGLLMAGTSWVMTLSLMNVTIQLSSPRWVVGRMLAIYQTAVFGGFAAGSWFWGRVAEAHSVTIALLVSAIGLLAGTVMGRWCPIPELMNTNLSPSNRWQEPKLGMSIQPNSGPIVIEAEYTINEEDIPEFLEKMEARRKARIRDGAQHWMLARDLHQPEIWRISFQFPTWLEYIRHNSRITEHDAMRGSDLHALHRGSEPPRIRRMIERQTIVHPPSRIES